MSTATHTEPLCACGMPLHYTRWKDRNAVFKLCSKRGDYIRVACGDATYRVQRHYIALHGLAGADLPALAALGIVEKIEPEASASFAAVMDFFNEHCQQEPKQQTEETCPPKPHSGPQPQPAT